ncbi:hypothetical protein Trydic_g4007 [Trypoxylus dichotomus]
MIREDLEIRDVIRLTMTGRRFWRDNADRMAEGRWTKWAEDENANSRRHPRGSLKNGAKLDICFARG